jgi:glycosyltransferase involved in cell wall biosynthesis
MRILYLNPCGQMGGAETSLRELLSSVRAAEPDWELWLVLGEDGPLARIGAQLNVHVMVEPFPQSLARSGDAGNGLLATTGSLIKALAGTALYGRRLAGIVRTIQPDIIHTNGFKMHLLGSWIQCQKPVIWHIHDYVSTRRLMKCLLRRSAKRCAAAIVNSRSVAADVETLLPGSEIIPIYNAVDTDRFSPVGGTVDLDSLAGLPPAELGTVRVGLVATFARWKGHKVFLQALAALPSEVRVRGYIIGGPIYQTNGSQYSLAELRQETARLGIASKLGFTGYLEDTAAAMRSLDIVVHASTQAEPFGMVIIEAMACGRAVIAGQAGGAAELFEHDQNAMGHPPGDVQALSGHIMRLAADQGLRARLGRAGRDTVERLFTSRRLSQQVRAVYRTYATRAYTYPAPAERGVSAYSD